MSDSFVVPDLGQTVCKGYQQTTKVTPSGQRVKYKTTFWLKQWVFSYIPGVKLFNSLDSDQTRHFVSLIWVQTVCKGYQQTTKVTPSGQRVKYKTTFDTTFWLKPWLTVSLNTPGHSRIPQDTPRHTRASK